MIRIKKNILERNSYFISKGDNYCTEDWVSFKSWLELNADSKWHLNSGILHFDDDELSLMFALRWQG